MNINIELNRNFVNAYNKMQNEYGEEMARINGFSPSQLSYTDFIDNFIDTDTVADASVDGNANVGQKDIVTLINEMPKPHQKLLAFNKIFYELNKKYGFKTANEWLQNEWDGHLYMHDANTSTFVHYCWAGDLKDIAEKGLFFIENFNAEPPQHLETFIDFVKEYVSFTSNRSSGACGLPNLIPYMYYFWRKDCNEHYYTDNERAAKQEIQRFIYAINQPYCRNGIQSAFTNTSIFDHPYLEALFGGATFPDGSYMIDNIEGIMDFQKLFLETMAEIRSKNMMTFPVNTISLLRQNGKFVDEEFARWACEHNRKWNDSNLFVDSSVTSLSSCCRLVNNVKELGYFDSQNELEDAVLKEMYTENAEYHNYTFEYFKEIVSKDDTLSKTLKERIRAKQRDKDSGLGWFSSIGGTALKVGSCKVSTINLARLALENDTEEDYLSALEKLCRLDIQVLDCVRNIIQRNVDKGLLKNFSLGIVDFEHLYNTIGQ